MVKKVVKKRTPEKKVAYFAVQEGMYSEGPFDSIKEAQEAADNHFDYDYDASDTYIVMAVLKGETQEPKITWKAV